MIYKQNDCVFNVKWQAADIFGNLHKVQYHCKDKYTVESDKHALRNIQFGETDEQIEWMNGCLTTPQDKKTKQMGVKQIIFK